MCNTKQSQKNPTLPLSLSPSLSVVSPSLLLSVYLPPHPPPLPSVLPLFLSLSVFLACALTHARTHTRIQHPGIGQRVFHWCERVASRMWTGHVMYMNASCHRRDSAIGQRRTSRCLKVRANDTAETPLKPLRRYVRSATRCNTLQTLWSTLEWAAAHCNTQLLHGCLTLQSTATYYWSARSLTYMPCVLQGYMYYTYI